MHPYHQRMLAEKRGELFAELNGHHEKVELAQQHQALIADPDIIPSVRRDLAHYLREKGFKRRSLLTGLAASVMLPSVARALPASFSAPATPQIFKRPSTSVLVKPCNNAYATAAGSGYTYQNVYQIPKNTWAVRLWFFNDQSSTTFPITNCCAAPTANINDILPSGPDVTGNTPSYQAVSFNTSGSPVANPFLQPTASVYSITSPTNSTGSTGQYALFNSDWLLVAPVARSDGGNDALLSVRVYSSGTMRIQTSSFLSQGTTTWGYPSASSNTGGPVVGPGIGLGTRFTTAGNCAVTPFNQYSTVYTNWSAVYAVECLTANPGYTLLTAGDSIQSSLHSTGAMCGFGAYATRALSSSAKDISASVPGPQWYCVNEAYSGRTLADFTANANLLIKTFPSAISCCVTQGWSRNGTGFATPINWMEYQQFTGQHASYCDSMGIPLILATTTPCYYGSGAVTDSNRTLIDGYIRNSGRPYLDLCGLWGDNESPQGYQQTTNGYTYQMCYTDLVHPLDIALQLAGSTGWNGYPSLAAVIRSAIGVN